MQFTKDSALESVIPAVAMHRERLFSLYVALEVLGHVNAPSVIAEKTIEGSVVNYLPRLRSKGNLELLSTKN